MTGSGPSGAGGGAGGGAGAGASGTDCTNIFEQTTLASPDAQVLRQLQPTEVLRLELQGPQGPLLAKTDQGGTAGSVTTRLAQLIRCISEGYEFVAIVIAVNGGKCDVEIRPRGA